MTEHDPLVKNYSHLKGYQREQDALLKLKKIASKVKPIMRARGWKVGLLAEFYPDEHNLLGLNVNRGQKILLRLRYPGDRNQFLPFEEVLDTMLHELCHIVRGPHDVQFHNLWNQLRDEHEALLLKGYTGEGFLSEGHRLGGQSIPLHEARRRARAAAEKRDAQSGRANPGRRLGGAAPRPGQDIRSVIANAVNRRSNWNPQGCGSTNHTQREVQEISETASKNGFTTQAEEDAANEAAIAQAYWELVQEDEKKKYGDAYVPPTAQNPTGNGGGFVFDYLDSDEAQPPFTETAPDVASWACDACTLVNPEKYLACDACNKPRPEKKTRELEERKKANAKSKRSQTVIDLTSSPETKKKVRSWTGVSKTAAPPRAEAATWICLWCSNVMERQWWTCSSCGKMKDSSK